MTEFFQSLGMNYEWAWFVATIAGILLIALPLMLAVAYVILIDRKVWAAINLRKGPNVVGPFGLLRVTPLMKACAEGNLETVERELALIAPSELAAQLVAGDILAVLRELNRAAAVRGAVAAGEEALDDGARDELQAR